MSGPFQPLDSKVNDASLDIPRRPRGLLMADPYRYAAFISYSSKDASFAKRLHRALERYKIPIRLGKFNLSESGKQNRIYPVFRDREELAAGELSERIERGLRDSGALIVVCSPAAAQSPWVEEEIQRFLALGRRDRVFAILAANAPSIDEKGTDVTQTSFPPAFRKDSYNKGESFEPVAADARTGKDGFRNAYLKTVAGLVGIAPGRLIDRDARLRRGRTIRAALLAASAAITVFAVFVYQAQLRSLADYSIPIMLRGDVAGLPDGSRFLDCGSEPRCPQMVVVPGGRARVGDDDYPNMQSEVSVKRFAASATEITFDQWNVCVEMKGCRAVLADFGAGAMPVTNVLWEEAKEYAAWLTRTTGQSYRLLTSAEWEYAARAGTATRFGYGDDAALLDKHEWFSGNSGGTTHVVRGKEPNRFGLYDMLGNASEWVEGCDTDWDPANGVIETHLSNANSVGCQYYIARGGSWGTDAEQCRPDVAMPLYRSIRTRNNGFRVARPA